MINFKVIGSQELSVLSLLQMVKPRPKLTLPSRVGFKLLLLHGLDILKFSSKLFGLLVDITCSLLLLINDIPEDLAADVATMLLELSSSELTVTHVTFHTNSLAILLEMHPGLFDGLVLNTTIGADVFFFHTNIENMIKEVSDGVILFVIFFWRAYKTLVSSTTYPTALAAVLDQVVVHLFQHNP